MGNNNQQKKRIYSLRTEGITYRNIDIYYNYRSVKEIIPKGSGICLDVGARDSNFKEFIISQGYKYLSIDLDMHSCLNVVADGCCLPFVDDCLDCIVLSQVLEHVHDPQEMVKEVTRVLKPGGLVVGGVSFLEPFHNSYFNLSHRAVENILQRAGLVNICIETGVTGAVLIWARIIGLLGSKNLRMFSTVTRFAFPVKYLLKTGYWAIRLIRFIQRRDMTIFDQNVQDHYEAIALSIAGHILFSATYNELSKKPSNQ